jgi:coenzyme F420-dependent glucose-6-phosphate dehydrogenase
VWSWLGAAAVRTDRIVLGTGVTCPTLRYHPSIVAQAAATLATLAPRRFFLGLGTGEALNEYDRIRSRSIFPRWFPTARGLQERLEMD